MKKRDVIERSLEEKKKNQKPAPSKAMAISKSNRKKIDKRIEYVPPYIKKNCCKKIIKKIESLKIHFDCAIRNYQEEGTIKDSGMSELLWELQVQITRINLINELENY